MGDLHRGKILLDPSGDLLVAFELDPKGAPTTPRPVQMSAGYFVKKEGSSELANPAGPADYTYGAEFAVAFAPATGSRTITTRFGVTIDWINDTGADAYLAVFKGYQHPWDDVPVDRQIVCYFVMVATATKPDPESSQAVSTTKVKLSVDMNVVGQPVSPALEIKFAPIHQPQNGAASKLREWTLDGSSLVVDKLLDGFETGAYTIVGPASAQSSSAPAIVNINTASRDELIGLPGIGPALADRIIAEREVAPFVSIADIQRVNGIGPALVAQLSNLITV